MSIKSFLHGLSLRDFWNLFRHHTASGEISVQEAATKTITVIDQVLLFWTQEEQLFRTIISDEAGDSADKVMNELQTIKTDLTGVSTLPDVAAKLQDFRFADDNKRNDFYHSLVNTAALAFSDGKISLFEGLSLAAQVATYIKGNG